ncbi:MAG: MOSC N-terminal beta barrel domain-containing protein [Elusimicrobia bacterium]|nr:MOSC N-terminal beta barrel domain-containing protein [Elusimicrobiota bacterium]
MTARVAALRRYPVKSMGGEELASVPVLRAGIPGDRGWCLRETATGRVLSAKRFAPLLLCSARFLDEPRAGEPPPPAEVELPDGSRTRTDDPAGAAALSRLLGVEAAWSRQDAGGGHFDDHPLHLLTTAALKTMSASGEDFDARRFRPNVLIALEAPGRPEDAWPGGEVRLGTLALRVLKPVKRCVMTTLAQPGQAKAQRVLQVILASGGTLGVYARATEAGACAVGDAVSWTPPAEVASIPI